MAQFGVYRLPDGGLILDLQSDLVETGARVVAPLVPVMPELPPIGRLEPVFAIDGVRVALHVAELAAVPARLASGARLADLSGEDYAIRGALDLLFVGF